MSDIPAKPKRLTLFQRISLLAFDRPLFSLVIWLTILAFGIASYTTLLKREGFPDVSVPYSLINGPYLVNDAAKVDSEVAKPLSQFIVDQADVKNVTSSAGGNFFSIVIEYQEGTNSETASNSIAEAVKSSSILPEQARANFQPLGNDINERGDDVLLSVYAPKGDKTTSELVEAARELVTTIKRDNLIPLSADIAVIDPYVRGVDPVTGKPAVRQTTFDRYGLRTDQNNFYNSVTIGIKGADGADILKLDKQATEATNSLNAAKSDTLGVNVKRSYSIAPQITDQINNLQTALLEGLVAVLVVCALLIAIRASIITVMSMVLVITATLALLYVIGYSLNVITLFSLVLCLSLIVDDTIIMVEAIDAQRRKLKNAREVIRRASKKISRAMVAATVTATIGFAPLLFTGGILGSFIRAIPITVIASLFISLIVALAFIPFVSKYVLLRPKHLGKDGDEESPAHKSESRVASLLARPILWSRHHRPRQWSLGIIALVVGFSFIGVGGALFQKVTFNIFAPTKDSDQIALTIAYPQGTNIIEAGQIADRVIDIVDVTLGDSFKQASFYGQGSIGQGANQGATLYIDLQSFKKREPKSPELITKLNATFKDFDGAIIKTAQIDAGPPTANFGVRIASENSASALGLAGEVEEFMRSVELKRPDGTTAVFKTVSAANPDTISRLNAEKFLSVNGEFDGADISTLVLLAQAAVEKEFTEERTAVYGLSPDDISFDIGQEGDNQNAFKALIIAFPLLLLAIYFFLVWQFRSLLQPALIFLAIPFSIFGITTSLLATDNAFSFFTMLGFFALIGLSIKNTILLTDYANQARREGKSATESIALALQERFRPLIATSLTAIVSLIPLVLSNPFWEGLGITLIFGLLSSTFLVITVFPYYYLGAEYLRLKISRGAFLQWLILAAIVLGLLLYLKVGPAAMLAIPLTIIIVPFARKILHRHRSLR